MLVYRADVVKFKILNPRSTSLRGNDFIENIPSKFNAELEIYNFLVELSAKGI